MGGAEGQGRQNKVGSAGGVMQGGSLTGARMVLEGAHAVSVGWEGAHTLPCVRQPALDGPVGAARVYMLVRELRRDVGTAAQRAAQRPSQPL